MAVPSIRPAAEADWAAEAGRTGRRAWKRQAARWLAIAAFLAPALLVYTVFVLYPIVRSVNYSLYEWSGIGSGTYVGLANYTEALQDGIFWRGLGNNLILVVASIAIQLPIGLGLALLIATRLRGWRLFRTIYFFPLLLSTVAIGLIWINVYNPTFGLLNATLGALGLEHLERPWLGDESTALAAVIAVISWQYIPFYMVLFIAGLTTIPAELYEAARIDGSGSWRLFRDITLPLLRGVIRTAAILSLIGSLKYFDLIFVMTGGGPNRATELMATYMYERAFFTFRMGYGSAIATLLFLIAFVVSATVLYLDRRRVET